MISVRLDDEIKEKIERYELVAECGGGAVIVGLVIEVVLTAFFFEDRTWIGRWAPVVADVLVALGVSVEVLFARLARSQSGDLHRRSEENVAAANLKAQQASKEAAEARERTAEVERLTAWRRIDSETQDRTAAMLRPAGLSLDVLIQHQMSDPESYLFGRDIAHIFQKSGCRMVRFGANAFLSGNKFNLSFYAEEDALVIKIMEIFEAEGIRSFGQRMDLNTLLPSNEKAPNLYVFVGPRVPD